MCTYVHTYLRTYTHTYTDSTAYYRNNLIHGHFETFYFPQGIQVLGRRKGIDHQTRVRDFLTEHRHSITLTYNPIWASKSCMLLHTFPHLCVHVSLYMHICHNHVHIHLKCDASKKADGIKYPMRICAYSPYACKCVYNVRAYIHIPCISSALIIKAISRARNKDHQRSSLQRRMCMSATLP